MADPLRPQRILHLHEHYRGNYPLFNDFVLRLPPERFVSSICYLDRLSGEANELEAAGFPVTYLFDGGGRTRWQTVRRLRAFLRETPADLVHSQRYATSVAYNLASAGRRRIPHIWTVHSENRFRRMRRRLVAPWFFSKVDRAVGVSEAVHRDLVETLKYIGPGKFCTVQNGIDPARFVDDSLARSGAREQLGLPAEGFLIGMAARFIERKGHRHAVECFRGLARSRGDARLLLAGEGPLKEAVQEQVREAGLAERVIFLGHCPGIPAFLRSLDLFLITSFSEGLPLALLEAMASGLPVVTTDAGGIREAAEDLEGVIVREVSDWPGIEAGLVTMYGMTPEKRAALGLRNRERVAGRFNADRMAREMMAVYESVLSAHGHT